MPSVAGRTTGRKGAVSTAEMPNSIIARQVIMKPGV
eukprot:COSAG02_NODE_39118_length_420_cov_223.971963_1_plen_35_part_10